MKRPVPASPKTMRRASKPAVGPYDVATFALKDNLGYLITRTKTLLWESADVILAPFNVTLTHWIVIANLKHNGGMSPAEICKHIAYDRGAMTRVLDRLEEKDLVRRIKHPVDRRSVTLELTAKGHALYPKLLTVVVGGLNDLLVGFSPEEARQFEGFLKRIITRAPTHDHE